MKHELSLHVAPYRVELVSGKTSYASSIRDIYQDFRQEAVKAVFDRKGGTFLDLPTIWKSHRRKAIK